MNISKETISALENIYAISFYDEYVNEVSPEKATHLSIAWEKGTENYIGKSIKAPTKKEVTFDWVVGKLNADSVYKNFADHFNGIVKKYDLHAYPTTYGIGVFVGFGKTEKIREKIASELDKLGVQYTTEYSDAMYVFRYKISKSAENIKRIEEITKMEFGGSVVDSSDIINTGIFQNETLTNIFGT